MAKYLKVIEWEGTSKKSYYWRRSQSTKPQKAHGFNYILPWWPVARQPGVFLWLNVSIAGYDLLAICMTATGISFSLLGASVAWWWED